MIPLANIFEIFNGTLCVQGGWLYTQNVVTKDYYHKLCQRGFFQQKRRACKNTPALIEWRTMPEAVKSRAIQIAGCDPERIDQQSELEKAILPNGEAAQFFANYKIDDKKGLPMELRREYVCNAEVLTALATIAYDRSARLRKLGHTTKNLWFTLSVMVNNLDKTTYPHTLPANERRLKDRVIRFNKEGFVSLVHKNFLNKNSEKIKAAVADWLLAYYCLPNKPTIPMLLERYDEVRIEEGYPQLGETAILKFLNEPERKRVWTLARHGKEAYDKQFGHTIKRDKSEWFANAYWAIDGTKLDFVYMADDGVEAKMKIDVVLDIYSEKILGWSLSESESHIDHFNAVKMAVKTAEHRPYLFTYDNQSGHKSAKMQHFYTSLIATGGTHYAHKAYSSSSPVEQIFNRLQQQVISTYWFSDKQGIKVRQLDNQPNVDFIKANKHKLLKKADIIKAWELCVSDWNNATHPLLSTSRNEAFAMPMPISHAVSVVEMIDLFCIEETKPKLYYGWGMPVTVAKETYQYEVYDADGKVDLDFRTKYVGKKLIVRYSPNDMDSYIGLYEVTASGYKRFVAYAEPKHAHETVPVLMNEANHSRWAAEFNVRNIELERTTKELIALQERTGISGASLIEEQAWRIKTAGKLPKEERNALEATIFHDF